MSATYQFPDKPLMRAYVLDKREIFEVIISVEGQDYIQYHGEFDLGESAVELLYGEYKGIFKRLAEKQVSKERLLGHTSNMPQQHPYFGIATQMAHRLYDSERKQLPSDALPRLVEQLKTIQSDIEVLVSQCLNVELRQSKTVPELYVDLLHKGQFHIGELSWQTVMTEIVPIEALPPEKPGLMPKLLTADELHDRGVKTAIAEVLYPESVMDLYCYLKARYLCQGVRFKPCKHCGRYFVVVGNSGTEYCNRPIPGSTKTCRQIGAIRIYQSRQLENPAIKAFTKSYKTHNARVRYGTLTHEQFAAWSKEARAMRDACVAGKLPLDEFQEWLDNH